jgi:hypothetical protein
MWLLWTVTFSRWRKYYGNPEFVYGVAGRAGSDGVVLDPALCWSVIPARSVAVTAFGGRWLMVV